MIRTCARQVCNLLRSTTTQTQPPPTLTLLQQTRNTHVFRRMYPPRLYKKGETKSLKKRERVYIVEDNTNARPAGDMELILMHDIEGLGFAGDKITVSKRVGRNVLLPASLAVYASEENIAKTEHLRKEKSEMPRQSIWAQKTVRQLSHMNLPIPMNPNLSWTLNKTLVRVAFRSVGVQMTDDCIVLPVEPVTETGDITLTVIVNGMERVPVKATVYHYYSDPRQAPGGVLPVIPPVWADTSVSIVDIAIEHARKMGPAPPPLL